MIAYNVASAVFKMAASQPDTLAIALPAAPGKPLPHHGLIPYHEISFKTLAHETNCISTGLLSSGFQPGDRVVVMVPPCLEFFTLCFACLQAGIIPVLIDPGIGPRNLKQCINEAQPEGFIGITKAHAARVLFGWGRSTIKRKITIGQRLFWGGGSLKSIRQAGEAIAKKIPCFDAQPDDIAAILFTSGSTGISKGVIYTHGNFFHQVEMIKHTFGVCPGEIDLPTFPPFALFNPAAGMSSIIPDMDPARPAAVDPERIIRAIRKFNVTSMFGSPALIDRVGRYGEANTIKLPGLKRVISAGAPVSAKTIKRFSSMLNPTTQVFTPYGATEAMPVTSIGSHEVLKDESRQRTDNGGGICIGKPVNNLDAQVIRITDDPITAWSDDLVLGVGEVGEIVVKGKNVTRSYFNRETANKLAKISDGNSFRHRMGDLGYKDNDGNLWFCGRKSHRVTLANRVLYSVPCECIFNKHKQVYRTALVGVDQKAVLCVEIDKDVTSPNLEKLKHELLGMAAGAELTRDIQTILFHPSFPVDFRHNAKIAREKLAVWAASQLK